MHSSGTTLKSSLRRMRRSIWGSKGPPGRCSEAVVGVEASEAVTSGALMLMVGC